MVSPRQITEETVELFRSPQPPGIHFFPKNPPPTYQNEGLKTDSEWDRIWVGADSVINW